MAVTAVLQGQITPAAAAQPMYAEAKQLAAQTAAQFASVRGAGAGVAGGSCCAAVAVVAHGGWVAPPPLLGVAAPLPYSIVFGNSQMMARGLALGVQGGHAERAALTAANADNLALYLGGAAGTDAVLYVELMPCIVGHNCAAWFGLVAGTPADQPYAAAFPGQNINLNIWFGYATTPAMNGAHDGGYAAEALAIAAW